MTFNTQGFQFTALPTNLRGKIQPNQLAVLWVIESYAGKTHECYPSYKTIADATCLSVRTVHKVVNPLESIGWLQRINRHENGKKSNLYKVNVWHLANVPEPSGGAIGNICPPYKGTTPKPNTEAIGKIYPSAKSAHTHRQNLPIPRAADAHELDTIKLDSKNIGVSTGVKKKNKINYPREFEVFFDKYKKIENRASEQSKKLAYIEYKKVITNITENDNNPHELLVTCLKQAIIEQQQMPKKGGFSTTFPNCFRWLKNGSYETYLPAPEIKKQQNNPWEKDKPKGKEVPF